VLDEIIAKKKEEVEHRKEILPLAHLKKRIAQQKPSLNFALALKGKPIQLIAEVKQASPSRGILCPDFNPAELATTYVQGGASAISVLTEVNYFKGSIDHLATIREMVKLPLLRKDFIFDSYQVYESRAYGADALLLIAAILSQEQLNEFLSLSHSLGLKCLVEVHNKSELERTLLSGAEIIGINNRDLSTFTVDINTTGQLRPLIPKQKIVVAESGIKSRNDIDKLKGWGVDAVLIGEALVTADNILTRMKELMS